MTKTHFIAGLFLIGSAGAGFSQAAGDLSTGISYSTKYGTTAFVSLYIEDIAGKGVDVGATYRAGDEGYGASARVTKNWALDSEALGQNAELSFSVRGSGSDWDFQSYEEETLGAALGLSADLTETLSYRTELFWSRTKIKGFGDEVSPFISADEGSSHAAGVGGSLTWSTRADKRLMTPGASVYGSVRLAGLGGGREYTQVMVGTDNTLPLFGRSVLNVVAEAGSIDGGGDGSVSVIDRIFLGGAAPRGFAYGGIGPRDADTDDSLGGTRYVRGSFEVLTPLPRPDLSIGVFADFGSVWDLPGATDAVDSNDYFLRSSAGLSLNWDAGFGRLRASIAEPMRKRDVDDEQTFSLSLNAVF